MDFAQLKETWNKDMKPLLTASHIPPEAIADLESLLQLFETQLKYFDQFIYVNKQGEGKLALKDLLVLLVDIELLETKNKELTKEVERLKTLDIIQLEKELQQKTEAIQEMQWLAKEIVQTAEKRNYFPDKAKTC